MINSFHGFELEESVAGPLDRILLFAPLKLEMACYNKSIEHTVCKETEIGKSGRPKTRIKRLLSRILEQYREAHELIKANKIDEIQSLLNYEKWWVGLFDIDRAEEIIVDIHDFIDQYDIPCGYEASSITQTFITLDIWYDR